MPASAGNCAQVGRRWPLAAPTMQDLPAVSGMMRRPRARKEAGTPVRPTRPGRTGAPSAADALAVMTKTALRTDLPARQGRGGRRVPPSTVS